MLFYTSSDKYLLTIASQHLLDFGNREEWVAFKPALMPLRPDIGLPGCMKGETSDTVEGNHLNRPVLMIMPGESNKIRVTYCCKKAMIFVTRWATPLLQRPHRCDQVLQV